MTMLFSVMTPLSVQGKEFESTVISDLSIQGLRDVKNLEVDTKTHVFVTTYPEEGVELLVDSKDSSIAEVSLEEIVVQAKKAGTTTIEVTAKKDGKIENGQFNVQVIEPVYKQTAHTEVNINDNDWRFKLEKDMEKVPDSQTVPTIDKNVFLEVQGACKITDVYVDGKYLG